MKHKKSRASYQ